MFCLLYHIMDTLKLVCPVIGDVKFDHVVKVLSTEFLISPFLQRVKISFSLCN